MLSDVECNPACNSLKRISCKTNWQVEVNAAKLVFPRGDTTKSEFLQIPLHRTHLFWGTMIYVANIYTYTVSYSKICSTIQSREKSCKKLRGAQRRCSNGWKSALLWRLIVPRPGRDSRDFILRCRNTTPPKGVSCMWTPTLKPY